MAEAGGARIAGRVLRGHPVLRRGSGWLLLAAVSLTHFWAADRLVTDTFGWGDRERLAPRMEVTFVRELMQAKPPDVPPPVAQQPVSDRALPAVAQRPAQAASAAASAAVAVVAPPEPEPEPAPMPPPVALAPPPEAAPPPAPPLPPIVVAEVPAPSSDATASAPGAPASAASPLEAAPLAAAPLSAAPVSASASQVAAFEWPPSTRLSYILQGHVNGPVDGTAQVEWLRTGQRYQVRFDVLAATFFSRRSVSDGELTARGLEPRQFHGEQRFMFKSRRWTQQFEAERITLSDGPEQPTAPGVQDEASQFVQLTWLFTTQPSLLQVGRSIEIPLMINRRLDRWVYDVIERETLRLSFGEVPTFHVKPRRVRPGALAVEMWFAPSLQYLPVRILVRQDETNHMDLMLKSPPLQAEQTTR
jgi:hypothetical protein